MLYWGPLFVLLAQATSPVAAPVVEPECHIPAAPPCIPFSDPRWRVKGCKIETGACFVLGVVEEPLKVWAYLTISPACEDKESRVRLRDAALKALSDSGYAIASSEEEVVTCSDAGFVDVKVTVEEP